MGTSIEVCCGTRRSEIFSIDLDSYAGKAKHNGVVNAASQQAALEMLKDIMDQYFAKDHYRNRSAVNSCIALHVLGYDALEWLKAFCAEQEAVDGRWFNSDLDKFMEHVECVVPYLEKWGPEGHVANALGFALD